MQLTRILVVRTPFNTFQSIKRKFDSDSELKKYIDTLRTQQTKVIGVYFVDNNGNATLDTYYANK